MDGLMNYAQRILSFIGQKGGFFHFVKKGLFYIGQLGGFGFLVKSVRDWWRKPKVIILASKDLMDPTVSSAVATLRGKVKIENRSPAKGCKITLVKIRGDIDKNRMLGHLENTYLFWRAQGPHLLGDGKVVSPRTIPGKAEEIFDFGYAPKAFYPKSDHSIGFPNLQTYLEDSSLTQPLPEGNYKLYFRLIGENVDFPFGVNFHSSDKNGEIDYSYFKWNGQNVPN